MRLGVLLFIVLILTVIPVHGARIHGTIYDTHLNPAKGVEVEIDSEPVQRHISKYGGYSFELEAGNYTISVYLKINDSRVLITQEDNVIVKSTQGDYVKDLFAQEVTFDEEGAPSYFVPLSIFAIFVLFLIVITLSIILFNKRTKKTKEKPVEKVDSGDDMLKNKILSIMGSSGGKLTQKEIRRKISLSEAKVSQLVRDLESEGRVRKVRQGRINIIVKA